MFRAVEELKNVFLGTSTLADNAFQERCGIPVDPVGNVYSMLQMPEKELSKIVPNAPPGFPVDKVAGLKAASAAISPQGPTEEAPSAPAAMKAPPARKSSAGVE